MITVALHGAEFFAFHGFYPEEQKLGCKFIVDADVSFVPAKNLKEDKISNTVDYEQVYAIMEANMRKTSKLIETVAQSIADEIKERFPFAAKIKVSIKKMNPPIKGIIDHSLICIEL